MTLRLMCMSQNYRSHARAAQAYIDIFEQLPGSLVTPVDDIDAATVSYLHMEPDEIAALLDKVPALNRTYRIGYCVWESDILPQEHVKAIARLDEVWTASFYNWLAFSKVHPQVHWIPHVTDAASETQSDDAAAMRETLQLQDDTFCYLFIAEGVARKNIPGLKAAFYHVHKRRPDTRLIIKTNSSDATLSVTTSGGITVCSGSLSESQLAALYSLCDTYVGAHFSEGWGLPFVEAMQRRKLCIATGHSGNRDFMTSANSLLINYTLKHIDRKHLYYLFDQTMSWAYPHQESIEQNMLDAYRMVTTKSHKPLVDRAERDVRLFDARHVRCLIRARLKAIAQTLAQGDAERHQSQ